jgi:predicted RNase H-like HicB family nuclease
LRFPIAIETGNDTTAYGVVVPDLPGCYSAGDTLDEALANAKEAILLYLEGSLDAGTFPDEPSTLQALKDRPEFAGWTWAEVDVALPLKTTPFHVLDYLTTEEEVAAYLEAAAEENDPESFEKALKTAAEARRSLAAASKGES